MTTSAGFVIRRGRWFVVSYVLGSIILNVSDSEVSCPRIGSALSVR